MKEDLLNEIQAAAADDTVSLSSVLRQCQLLAARLGYKPLKDWVEMEANGYRAGVELPSYRIMRGVASKATFIGPHGTLSNWPVPENVVPDKELQNLIAMMTLRDSVAVYESMLRDLAGLVGGGLKSPWPAGIAETLLQIDGMRCTEAWQELPASSIAGMLSQVRNRVLAFTIEIQEANLEVEKPSAGRTAKQQEQVATIYQTVIHGGQQTIVHGGTVEQHIAVAQGDLVGMIVNLRELGVPVGEITELTHALEADRSTGDKLGKRTTNWLEAAGKKVASGAWKLAAASTPEVIAAVVKSFLGLH
jgi:hypothetical protein